MRIVYVNDGVSTYDHFFIDRLALCSDISLITFRPFLKEESALRAVYLREPGYKYNNSGYFNNFYTALLRAPLRAKLISDYFRSSRSDILIVNEATKYGLVGALSTARPLVLVVWGSDILIWPAKSPLWKAVAESSLEKAQLIVVDSHYLMQACVNLGADQSRIIKFPWFDFSTVRRNLIEASDRQRIRAVNGLGMTDKVVISTRNHKWMYSLPTLIKAIPRVLKEDSGVRFILAGSGPDTPKLKQMVNGMGLQDQVRFVGNLGQPNLFKLLQASDIYVSTSISDSTSASLLEAMTFGLSCVISDLEVNKEWVTEGVTGFFFAVGDDRGLAEAILKLGADENLRERVGKLAIETVRQRASWEANGAKLTRALVELMESRGSARI